MSNYNKLNYPIQVIHRFWNFINIPNNLEDCWYWTGFKDKDGYGKFSISNGNVIGSHRFVYECYNGIIQNNNIICHSCDNPSCVNPNHLWEGTHDDNIQDMIQKNRKIVCCGEENNFSTLFEYEVEEILNGIVNGIFTSTNQIIYKYTLSVQGLHDILNGRSWKHITCTYNLPYLKSKITRKFIDSDVVESIKEELKNGISVSILLKKYKISQSSIYKIRRTI